MLKMDLFHGQVVNITAKQECKRAAISILVWFSLLWKEATLRLNTEHR